VRDDYNILKKKEETLNQRLSILKKKEDEMAQKEQDLKEREVKLQELKLKVSQGYMGNYGKVWQSVENQNIFKNFLNEDSSNCDFEKKVLNGSKKSVHESLTFPSN